MKPHDTEDELFRETHYARFGYERTNIYGLALLDSHKAARLHQHPDFPSHRYETYPTNIDDDGNNSSGSGNSNSRPLLSPTRHLLMASSNEMVGFVSRNGYWNSVNMALGLPFNQTEMIAMDCVEYKDQVLLAVAVAEKEADSSNDQDASCQYALYIYSNRAPYLEQALINIGENRQTIPLSSAPMHLTHAWHRDGEPLFLLSSMDGQVHMYKIQGPQYFFLETDHIGSYFPMMGHIADLRIKILFMHIYDRPNGERVICAGGQNGDVIVALYDKDGLELKRHHTRVFSPITSVLVFPQRVSKTVRPDDELHVVVTCAIELAIVYRSIEVYGLSKNRVLPQSGQYDSVLCSHAMDVDWDGENEILIGTYGRQILIYKQVPGTQDYNVLWRRQFAYPIYRITHLDINRDGLDELIVSTMYGVHIFQPNMKRARERLLEVLQHVEGNKRRIYESLVHLVDQKRMEKEIVFEST